MSVPFEGSDELTRANFKDFHETVTSRGCPQLIQLILSPANPQLICPQLIQQIIKSSFTFHAVGGRRVGAISRGFPGRFRYGQIARASCGFPNGAIFR